jgi:hypothetical protein
MENVLLSCLVSSLPILNQIAGNWSFLLPYKKRVNILRTPFRRIHFLFCFENRVVSVPSEMPVGGKRGREGWLVTVHSYMTQRWWIQLPLFRAAFTPERETPFMFKDTAHMNEFLLWIIRIYPTVHNYGPHSMGNVKKTYSCNRPWRPIRLWDIQVLTLPKQSAHRWSWGCQTYAPAALCSLETFFSDTHFC